MNILANPKTDFTNTATAERNNAAPDIVDQIVENLKKIDPVYENLGRWQNDGKYVLLAEACNDAAKKARDLFKSKRDAAKEAFVAGTMDAAIRDEEIRKAKEFDELSGGLMKAAKFTLLPLALQHGAMAYETVDGQGQKVILLEHQTAGRIALHGINLSNQPEIESKITKAENHDKVFTGLKRQSFSAEIAALITEDAAAMKPQTLLELSRNPQEVANFRQWLSVSASSAQTDEWADNIRFADFIAYDLQKSTPNLNFTSPSGP